MKSHRSASHSAESQGDLIRELELTLEWLCRRCPEQMRARAAHEELVGFRPRVQEAIEALENTRDRRDLNEEERTLRRTFGLLLVRDR